MFVPASSSLSIHAWESAEIILMSTLGCLLGFKRHVGARAASVCSPSLVTNKVWSCNRVGCRHFSSSKPDASTDENDQSAAQIESKSDADQSFKDWISPDNSDLVHLEPLHKPKGLVRREPPSANPTWNQVVLQAFEEMIKAKKYIDTADESNSSISSMRIFGKFTALRFYLSQIRGLYLTWPKSIRRVRTQQLDFDLRMMDLLFNLVSRPPVLTEVRRREPAMFNKDTSKEDEPSVLPGNATIPERTLDSAISKGHTTTRQDDEVENGINSQTVVSDSLNDADTTTDRIIQVPVPSEASPSVADIDAGDMLSSRRASGRSCLVTGATSGIGYEVTKRLVLEGAAHIRIVTRDSARGQEMVKRIRKETGQLNMDMEVIEGDLRTSVAKVPDTILFGDPNNTSKPSTLVDTLVLCAGMPQSQLIVGSPEGEATNEILSANLQASIRISSRLLRLYHRKLRGMALKLAENTDGSKSSSACLERSFCIVSISSLLANKGGFGASVYAASKAGLVAFNRALSLEAGAIYKGKRERHPRAPTFRVNTVLPGYIDTPMTQGITGEGRQSLEDQIPIGRFGKAEEVADAVLFLIANGYANNCTLNLDGGLSAT